ncbi:RNA-directed DNA polymerase [Mucilaginibacter sp. JRF]|uniref:reverse transcriptase family protein n=1 Tax=Mucilaginibacter sp. JRF TaxID=2780088 RepID=UPI0018826C49|nr:reverse transcriptase family protein [Mucilaginibacter sp. JRF]MBE9584544.1 RNA-directed DNA polymerase [Mucilaginibacter sp. JRF]
MKFGTPQENSDGSFKKRDIIKPVYYIKVLQRGLNDQLKNLEIPDCMYGGITERNNVVNALEHISGRFFFTVDLKGFFNNITNSQVHQTLISRGFTWNEARAITNLTTYKGSLPQGAPTSTTLANLVFSSTAEFLETFCKERNITFTVFVDDLTFSSIECFKKHTNQILETLKQNGFFVNHRKIHYRKHSCEVTGIIIRKGKLFLPKEIISHRNKPGVDKYIESVLKQYNAYKAIANYK